MIHFLEESVIVRPIILKWKCNSAIRIRYNDAEGSSNEIDSLTFLPILEGWLYITPRRLGSVPTCHRSSWSIATSHIDFTYGPNIWGIGWTSRTRCGIFAERWLRFFALCRPECSLIFPLYRSVGHRKFSSQLWHAMTVYCKHFLFHFRPVKYASAMKSNLPPSPIRVPVRQIFVSVPFE